MTSKTTQQYKFRIHRPCPLLLFFLVVLSPLLLQKHCSAKEVECTTNYECVQKLRDGSTCNSNGFCTNPFIDGCLQQKVDGIENIVEAKLRVCNSDDPPDAVQRKICQEPNPYFNYTEIRIAPADWDSAVFFAWIMQILLSEILLVPATIENGKKESSSFYDETNGLSHTAVKYPWEGFVTANKLKGDCSQAKPTEFCNHVHIRHAHK